MAIDDLAPDYRDLSAQTVRSNTMRTCTVMTFTNGRTSTYATLRGKMRGRYFDSGSAEIVATWTWYSELGEFDYSDATRQVATKDAPAVYWQQGRPL